MFINHINVNWNQFCPATPPLPQLTNQKLYFSARYSPPSTPNSPYPTTQNKPQHGFSGGTRAHIFAAGFFLSLLIFSSFFHVFLGQRWADEYKYLGASHCYSLGRLAHISCKSCPPPGRAATLFDLFLVQQRRVFALVEVPGQGRRGATGDKVYLQASICKLGCCRGASKAACQPSPSSPPKPWTHNKIMHQLLNLSPGKRP